MKKVLYAILILSIIFVSCKKEDDVIAPVSVYGCTDPAATNYNSNATNGDNSCIYSIVGVWVPTSVVKDSSLTTTIAGEVVQELNGELMTYSGSETITPAEAEIVGNLEFTNNGKMFVDGDTMDYTYSNSLLTVTDLDTTMILPCLVTSTNLSLTFEMSMDTAFNEPSLVFLGFANGDVTVSSYFGQTIQCSRNAVVSTNVSQSTRETNSSFFIKPKIDNNRIINKLKKLKFI
jgi:hypothetical protein